MLESLQRGHQLVAIGREALIDLQPTRIGDDHRPVPLSEQLRDHLPREVEGALPATQGQVRLIEVEQVAGQRAGWGDRLGPFRRRIAGLVRHGSGKVAQPVELEIGDPLQVDFDLEIVAGEAANLLLVTEHGDVELNEPSLGPLDQANLLRRAALVLLRVGWRRGLLLADRGQRPEQSQRCHPGSHRFPSSLPPVHVGRRGLVGG